MFEFVLNSIGDTSNMRVFIYFTVLIIFLDVIMNVTMIAKVIVTIIDYTRNHTQSMFTVQATDIFTFTVLSCKTA